MFVFCADLHASDLFHSTRTDSVFHFFCRASAISSESLLPVIFEMHFVVLVLLFGFIS